MTRIIIDPSLSDRLRKLATPAELCDETGAVVGRYLPGAGVQPQISEEEIARRKQEPGGRPLREILADLEKRG